MTEDLRALAPLLATPAGFAYLLSGRRWIPAPHLLMLSEWLCDAFHGRRRRVIVAMPPRHGKSELTSVYYPAWCLCLDPDSPVILCSYGAELAEGLSRRARALVAQFGPELFGVAVSQASSAVGRWDIQDHKGGLVAAGVGGPITGRGARVFIIDDPVKNQQEAQSEVYRERIWQWWLSTARPRVEPAWGSGTAGSVVLVMTRWHEDDLAGRLIAQGGWDVLRLPALAEAEDPLGRTEGDALWPHRFSRPELEEIRTEVLGQVWSALFQQSPQPAGGGLFKRQWFHYFTFEPAPMGAQSWQEQFGTYILTTSEGEKRWPSDRVWRFGMCDPAATLKASADWFVLSTWGVTPDAELLLLDVVRVRVQGPEGEDLIAEGYTKWRPAYQGVEEIAVGADIAARLVRKGLPIRPVKPGHKDKYTRALTAAARYQTGQIYHRAGALWLGDWEAELLAFPTGAHDDQVDTVSYAALELYQPEGPPPPRKPEVARMIDEILARQQDREGESW